MIAGEGLPVKVACRVLGVSVSGYYDWLVRPPSARSLRHIWLIEQIRLIHAESRCTYGARRVHAELTLGRGIAVGRHAVEHLMRRATADQLAWQASWQAFGMLTRLRSSHLGHMTTPLERALRKGKRRNCVWLAFLIGLPVACGLGLYRWIPVELAMLPSLIIFALIARRGFRKIDGSLDPTDDPRPPFVLSRSSSDTSLTIGPDRISVDLNAPPRVYSGRSIVEEIDSHLAELGRLILIQTEKEIDWSRYDFIVIEEDIEGDSWPSTFLFVAVRARGVLILPADTQGVVEELVMIRASSLLDKTLVIMPPVGLGSASPLHKEAERRQFADAWGRAQMQLNCKLDLNIPDYCEEGLAYIPARDFSIERAFPLHHSWWRVEEAIEELVPDGQLCQPLGETIDQLERQGIVRIDRRRLRRLH